MSDSRCAESSHERRQLVLARRREIVRLAGAALSSMNYANAKYAAMQAVELAVQTQRRIDELEGKDGF